MSIAIKTTCIAFLLCVSFVDVVSHKAVADGLKPYAQIKASSRYIVARDTLKWTCRSRFPVRGVVISYGGLFTRSLIFYMVNIDKRALRKIRIDTPTSVTGQPLQSERVVWLDSTVEISKNELDPIIERMNYIWEHGVSHEFEIQSTDITDDMLLLDRDKVFSDQGSPTHGLDKTIVAEISDLVKRHDLALSGGTSTDIPCDPDPLP